MTIFYYVATFAIALFIFYLTIKTDNQRSDLMARLHQHSKAQRNVIDMQRGLIDSYSKENRILRRKLALARSRLKQRSFRRFNSPRYGRARVVLYRMRNAREDGSVYDADAAIRASVNEEAGSLYLGLYRLDLIEIKIKCDEQRRSTC